MSKHYIPDMTQNPHTPPKDPCPFCGRDLVAPKIYTQSDVAAKVAEARLDQIERDFLSYSVELDGDEKLLISIKEEQIAQLTNTKQEAPHTLPQEQTIYKMHTFNTYGKCTKCGRLRPETAINEVCTPQEQKEC